MANLETTVQITKLLQEQNKLFSAQAKTMKGNLAIMQAMSSVMAGLPAKEISDNFAKANEAIKDADKAIQQATNSTTNLNVASKKASDSNKILGMSFEGIVKSAMNVSIAMEGWNKFKGTLSFLKSAFSGIISTVSTLGSVLIDVGASIISAPFKMLGSLITSAGQGGGGEFRQAVEDVRKEFGQLATNEAQAVMKGFRGIRGDLAETGISSWRILGNMAERLKAITEIATKMGPAFSSLQTTFTDKSEIERLAAYAKGLGLTDVGIKGLADRALVTGKSFNELSREITNFAFKVGPAFGINGKIVSRAVGEMSADIKNFGTLGIKTMTSIAIYTRKLGMEAKDLQGVISKFTDFESAAESAALLSQSFGMNIDAIKMMKEQDPAKQLQMLREEFLKTGRDITTMNRAERELLATQTGFTDDTLVKAFSKQGMSYDKVGKEAEKAEKKQLSQAEAMDKLAMSIERLVKSGGGITGFWDAFTKGINRGIVMSKEFREMYRSVQRALYATRMAGMQVGRAIVEFWPGVKSVFAGIRDIFREIGSFTQKLKVKGFMNNVAKEIRAFLKNPEAGPGALLKNLKEKFFNIFNADNPAVKNIISGAKDMFKMLAQVMAMSLKVAIEEVTKGFQGAEGIFRALRMGPKSPEWAKVFGGAGQIKDGFMGFLGEILEPFIDIWNDPKLLTQLNKAFVDLISEMWSGIKSAFNTHVWPKLESFWNDNWVTIIGASSAVIFGPAIISMLLVSMIRGVVMLMGSFASKAAPIVGKGMIGLFGNSKLMEGLGSAAKTSKGLDTASAGLKPGGSMVKNILGMAAGILVIGTAIALTVKSINAVLGDMSESDVNKSIKVMIAGAVGFGAVAVSMAVLMAAGSLITATGGAALLAMGAGIAGLSVVAVAMAIGFISFQDKMRKIDLVALAKFGAVVSTMTMAFAAAAGVIVGSGIMGILAVFGAGLFVKKGLEKLQNVINVMIEKAIIMIDTIKSINIDSSFISKAEALGTVIGFYKTILEIVDPFISTGLISSVYNSIKSVFGDSPGEAIRKQLEPITSFVDNIIMSFRDLILSMSSTMSSDEVGKISAISQLISTFGDVLKTIAPATEMFTGANTTIVIKLTQAGKYVKEMSAVIKDTLLPGMMDFIKGGLIGLEKISTGDINKFKNIFGMISTLLGAITPSADFIKAFETHTKSVKATGGRPETYEKTGIDIEAMGAAMAGVGTSITKFIDTGKGKNGWINSVVTMVSDMPALFKGKNIKSGMQQFKIVTESIESMMRIVTTFSTFQKDFGGGDAAMASAITVSRNIFSKFPQLLNPMETNMPAINTSFINLEAQIKELKTGHIEIVASSLVGMVKSVNDTKTNLATLLSSPLNISAELGKVADKLGIKDKSEFTIKHNDININVQLNLKVDADKFLDVLLETDKGKKVYKPGA